MNLIKKGYECKGFPKKFMGHTSSAEVCASMCRPSSTIFVYGMCNSYGCRCYCELWLNDGYCEEEVKNYAYDLYSAIRLGEDE